ncbi:MAG: hypothetical protein ABS76_26665 [Pelagibacterium sp. SCN 64-44]|nr:MAG: hypothetical protein ABS76_26665 [Pelagibacterium sp. SCN 64-44]
MRGFYPTNSHLVVGIGKTADQAQFEGWAIEFPWDEPDAVVAHECTREVYEAFQAKGAFEVAVKLVEGVLQLDDMASAA